jgi:hypothetical protein
MKTLDLGRCRVQDLERREVGYPVQPPNREPRVRGGEFLLPGDEPGGPRLGEQVQHVRRVVQFRGWAQRVAALGVVGRDRARRPRPLVKAVAARLPADPSGHVFRGTGQELVQILRSPPGVLQHVEYGHERRGRIKDHPAQHDDLGHPVSEAAAEPDGLPAAVCLSHQHRRMDAGCLDDRDRVVGQFVMAEIRPAGRSPRVRASPA